MVFTDIYRLFMRRKPCLQSILFSHTFVTVGDTFIVDYLFKMNGRDYDDDGYYDSNKGFYEIESMLMKDDLYGFNSKVNLCSELDFGKKINLSNRVENDIARSEKKGEKRSSNYGRDDRATSEQV